MRLGYIFLKDAPSRALQIRILPKEIHSLSTFSEMKSKDFQNVRALKVPEW